jgi:TolB-like protein
MRISLIRGKLINHSAKLLSFCMVGFGWFVLCGSTPTKAEEAFDSPLAKITDQIATAVNNANLKAVTVPGFTDLHDNESDLGLFLADQVSAGLVQKKCAVVDRRNIAKILAEHQLTTSGLVDPENAKKLGQFAGVDAIVIGTIIPLSGTIRVTVRVLATDSARVLAATSADIPKTNSIRHLIGESEIPEPTPTPSVPLGEEQATAALNFLQDRLRKPHVQQVWYDSATDSYVWIGPKFGKKVSMPRSQFEAEIWPDYVKTRATEH